jgi:hypothetical protein
MTKANTVLVGKPGWKESLGRQRHRWADKMVGKGLGLEGVDWII